MGRIIKRINLLELSALKLITTYCRIYTDSQFPFGNETAPSTLYEQLMAASLDSKR